MQEIAVSVIKLVLHRFGCFKLMTVNFESSHAASNVEYGFEHGLLHSIPWLGLCSAASYSILVHADQARHPRVWWTIPCRTPLQMRRWGPILWTQWTPSFMTSVAFSAVQFSTFASLH